MTLELDLSQLVILCLLIYVCMYIYSYVVELLYGHEVLHNCDWI